MHVDIAHVPDCPNVALARAHVFEALHQLGRAAVVKELEVTTEDDARTLGMRGSPTILIEGRDPFPSSEPPSLSCRLYDGMQGAPSVADLVEALADDAEADVADNR